MTETIFTTIHGSRLYGFAHASSDYDTFEVTDSGARRSQQTIRGESDHFTVGVHRFLNLALSGSHQSVEALFSPVKVWADTDAARRWRPLLESARVCGPDVAEKYERTIRKFCYGDFKRRRHAVRLSRNLEELRWSGRVDRVQLHPTVAAYCARLAEQFDGDALAFELGVDKPRKEGTGGLVQSG